jgi:hypothetical protein
MGKGKEKVRKEEGKERSWNRSKYDNGVDPINYDYKGKDINLKLYK